MKRRPESTLALVWGAIMIAVVSSIVTMLVTGQSPISGGVRWVSKSEYEMIERYSRLEEVRDLMANEYYRPLSDDELILGAIHGMTAAADDVYTFYYTPEELAKQNQDERGEYKGIGVLTSQTDDDRIELLRVYPDTPAEAAGLIAGDIVTSVDGVEIGEASGVGYDAAIEMIRGEVGSSVVLGILRGDRVFEVSVERADVKISYVSYSMLDDGIGYVAITQFTGDAADRFMEAIDYMRENGARGLVIDVRDNPGGLLTQVNRIADAILPEGIIVYIQDRDGKRTDYYSDAEYYDVPLVVLANGNSASASEILSASVQALGRGKVVGLTTFGKGIVQTMITFEEDGAGIQLTTSSYFDANGRSIHGVGVTPDVEVALDMTRVPLDPDPVSDNQLAAALELLRLP